MYRILRRLKTGVDYSMLDSKEKELFDKLKEARILTTSRHKGKKIYKLSDNVNMNYRDDYATFEVLPNRLMGVFFEYDDVFECKSSGKEIPIVYFLGYAINPAKEVVENFDVGNTVKVKVIARGHNNSNEGLLVNLPSREMEYFSMDGKPCITIGTAGRGKFMDTGKLDFNEDIGNTKFLEGRKGLILNGKVYYSTKDVDVTSTVYELVHKNDEFIFGKKEENKLYKR